MFRHLAIAGCCATEVCSLSSSSLPISLLSVLHFCWCLLDQSRGYFSRGRSFVNKRRSGVGDVDSLETLNTAKAKTMNTHLQQPVVYDATQHTNALCWNGELVNSVFHS